MVFGAEEPLYCPVLGLPPISEPRIVEAGRQSAVGAFYTILRGLTPRRRPGPYAAKVVNAAFGNAKITERDLGRARETFKEERAKESDA